MDLHACVSLALPKAYGRGNVRRLQDLVHALRAQCALDQVADGDGSYERGETRILTLLLGDIVRKDLSGVRLCTDCKWLLLIPVMVQYVPSCWWVVNKQGGVSKEMWGCKLWWPADATFCDFALFGFRPVPPDACELRPEPWKLQTKQDTTTFGIAPDIMFA